MDLPNNSHNLLYFKYSVGRVEPPSSPVIPSGKITVTCVRLLLLLFYDPWINLSNTKFRPRLGFPLCRIHDTYSPNHLPTRSFGRCGSSIPDSSNVGLDGTHRIPGLNVEVVSVLPSEKRP